jgi:hypothetical protein
MVNRFPSLVLVYRMMCTSGFDILFVNMKQYISL